MAKEPAQKNDIIMIIDDSEMDLHILSHMLLKLNLAKELLQYSIAKEALKYLTEHQENIYALPNIILLDLYMPMMFGFEFLEAYEKLSPTLKNYCKLFVVTSTLNNNDIRNISINKM